MDFIVELRFSDTIQLRNAVLDHKRSTSIEWGSWAANKWNRSVMGGPRFGSQFADDITAFIVEKLNAGVLFQHAGRVGPLLSSITPGRDGSANEFDRHSWSRCVLIVKRQVVCPIAVYVAG